MLRVLMFFDSELPAARETVLAPFPRRPACCWPFVEVLSGGVCIARSSVAVLIGIARSQTRPSQLAVAIPGSWISRPAVLEGDMRCVREIVIRRRRGRSERAFPPASPSALPCLHELIHFAVKISKPPASCGQREAWAPPVSRDCFTPHHPGALCPSRQHLGHCKLDCMCQRPAKP
jgi:hypothetical protein